MTSIIEINPSRLMGRQLFTPRSNSLIKVKLENNTGQVPQLHFHLIGDELEKSEGSEVKFETHQSDRFWLNEDV